MPRSEALTPCWIAFLYGHLGVAVADNLALTILTSADYELTRLTRCTSGAVAGQFSRIHHLPHLGPKRQESSPGATVVPSGGSRRTQTASLPALSAHSIVLRTLRRSSWHSYRLPIGLADVARHATERSLSEAGQ